MKSRKTNEVFSMSFLDIMACGFGALVLILLISEFQKTPVPTLDIKNDADELIETNNIKNIKSLKLKKLIEDVNSNIITLTLLNNNLNDMKNSLTQRTLISTNLSEFASDTNFSINKKINLKKISSLEQKEASGIKIDSKYLIFIIDNSPSMRDSAPWKRVIQEVDNLIQTFPDLEGYMVMNDAGTIIHGGSPWLKPTKINRNASIGFLKAKQYIMSPSNPVQGLKKSINLYGKKYSNVGVFIVGDDVLPRDNKRPEAFFQEIVSSNKDKSGNLYVRINSIAFLTSKNNSSFTQQNMNYLILMRELTELSGGALVVVN
tara:strand:+ start:1311 stop:2264 length:954 start_codon:yes stop_codon:yes gene_type:complete